MSATPKYAGKIQMCCLDTPFFPITCLIFQANKRGNNVNLHSQLLSIDLIEVKLVLLIYSDVLASFMPAQIWDSPVSLLVIGHPSEIFNGDCTESDLALNLFLRLFKSAVQMLRKTGKKKITSTSKQERHSWHKNTLSSYIIIVTRVKEKSVVF